jgi:hypothetical protein
MRTQVHKTVQFGELVVAVFDEAAQYSTDPEEVSRLATTAVKDMLERARSFRDGTPGFDDLFVEAEKAGAETNIDYRKHIN